MLRASKLQRASSLWRPHAEQIKQWLASPVDDMKHRALARNYVQSLKLTDTLADIDDCFEMMYLIRKLEFPPGTHFERSLRQFTSGMSPQLSGDVLHRLAHQMTLFPDFVQPCSEFLTQNNMFAELQRIVRELSSQDLLMVSKSVWSVCGQEPSSTVKSLLLVLSSSLARLISKEPCNTSLLLFLAEHNAPLWEESMDTTRSAVLSATVASQNLDFIADIMRILAFNNSTRNSQWISILQKSAVPVMHADDAILHVDIITSVVELRAPLCASFSKRMSLFVANYSGDLLRRTTSVLYSARYDYSDYNLAFSCLHSAVERCILSRITEEKHLLFYLSCLVMIDPEKGRNLFVPLCEQKGTTVLPCDYEHVFMIMAYLNIFPPVIVHAMSKIRDFEKMDQESCVYALYISARTGGNVDEALKKEATGTELARKFSVRGEFRPQKRMISNYAAVLLCYSLLKTQPSEDTQTKVIRLIDGRVLKVHEELTLLSLLEDLDTPFPQVRMHILRNAMRSINFCSEAQIVTLIRALTRANCRDAVSFETLLKELLVRKPCATNVIEASQAAKSLRLIPQFECSGIVDTLVNTHFVDESQLMALLESCSMPQRRKLLGHPGTRAMLEKVDVTSLSTDRLVLLLILSTTPANRSSLLLELGSRAPLAAAAISAEDAVAAIEGMRENEPFHLVIKLVGNCLSDVTESQMMRVYGLLAKSKSCSKLTFRVIGRILLRAGDKLSIENSILWLSFYSDRRVRDDSVGKALTKKCLSPRSTFHVSKEMEQRLHRASQFFGLARTKSVSEKRKKRRVFVGKSDVF